MSKKSDGTLRQMPCLVCTGQGYTSCTACGGVGYQLISKSRLRYDRTLEFYQDRLPCTICSGTARIICLSCKGAGWVLQ